MSVHALICDSVSRCESGHVYRYTDYSFTITVSNKYTFLYDDDNFNGIFTIVCRILCISMA